MATFLVTFANTLITPGSTAPIVTAGLGGNDLLVLDMRLSGADYLFTFGHVIDFAGMETFPDHSGSYYWYFPPVARYGVSYTGIERFKVLAGAGQDFIVTGQARDTVSGGGGNDTIFTKRGDAIVSGGAGTDIWTADFSDRGTDITVVLGANTLTGAGTSTMTGIEVLGYGAGPAQTFRTGSGHDTIDTASANRGDYIDTGAGNDSVTLRAGIDSVDMGDGIDTLVLRWAASSGPVYYGVSGGAVTHGQISDGVRFAGFSGVEQFDIQSGIHNDAFTTGDGNDTITTGAGNDHVSTRGGEIVLNMGGGSDLWGFDYRGQTQDITIDITGNVIFGLGGSTIAGVEGLRSNTGDSNAYTGDGNDTVVTHRAQQNDFLVTGAGNDRVTVFNGVDVLSLGTGVGDDDVLVVNYAAAVPVSPTVTAGMALTGNGDHVFSLAAGVGVNASGVERLHYIGGTFGSIIGGGLGNDTLVGGAVNDSLHGFAGTDTVTGGAGNDTLNGGDGVDRLTGGLGNDVFVFDAAPGNAHADVIADFTVADDILHLSAADFTGLATGALAAGALQIVTAGGATDTDDRIIYDTATGQLYFDADGSGAGAMIRFARLSGGLALTEADFLVIA